MRTETNYSVKTVTSKIFWRCDGGPEVRMGWDGEQPEKASWRRLHLNWTLEGWWRWGGGDRRRKKRRRASQAGEEREQHSSSRGLLGPRHLHSGDRTSQGPDLQALVSWAKEFGHPSRGSWEGPEALLLWGECTLGKDWLWRGLKCTLLWLQAVKRFRGENEPTLRKL